MFETARREFSSANSRFAGTLEADGAWRLDLDSATEALRSSISANRSLVLLGTAFLFVDLLDHLRAGNLSFRLPSGSRVLETGGYKGRSRTLPKAELHSLIGSFLGIPDSYIVSEYGMSELSSQAYDRTVVADAPRSTLHAPSPKLHAPSPKLQAQPGKRPFLFPPWAQVQVVSPETGREVAEGETGLIRVFDLANVHSVMAIQTEDLGIRRAEGFELIGRAELAEPRGCSLMST